MAEEKRTFSEKRSYPVFFMVIISIFFIGVLAVFYNTTRTRINKFNEISLKSAILKTFNLPVDEVEKTFNDHIKINENSDLVYYEAQKDSVLLGYCFLISGPGLWGTISALLTVSPDLEKIINIEIIKQNETPGLGGRITENWFKDQFKGKSLIRNNTVMKFTLIAEMETADDAQINQITGATFSSKAIVDIIAKEMNKIKMMID